MNNLFYEKERVDKVFRFGDVVKGFVFADIIVNSPVLSTKNFVYSMEIQSPEFFVILTPCCSIGDIKNEGIIAVTPLVKLNKKFLQSPFLQEDFTRLNRLTKPINVIPPKALSKLSDSDRILKENEEEQFVHVNYFVYALDENLPIYELEKHQIGHYMINFGKIYSLKCNKIKRTIDNEYISLVSDTKILQLSISSREDLRNKFGFFLTRPPLEDNI